MPAPKGHPPYNKNGEGGRPRVKIDAEEVEKLAALGCTMAEVADWFDCAESVISERFAKVFKKGKSKMNISLRRSQFIAATQDRNPTMLIWLGKILLKQKEEKEKSEMVSPVDQLLKAIAGMYKQQQEDSHEENV